MKKIAFLIPNLAAGGAEKSALVLAESLAALGHEIHLILIGGPILYSINTSYKIHMLIPDGKVSRIKLFHTFFLQRRLKHLLKQLECDKKFDYIVSHLLETHRILHPLKNKNTFYLALNIASNAFSKQSAKRQRSRKKLLKKIYRNQSILAISEASKKDLIENIKVKSAKIDVVYTPFDIEGIQERAKEKNTAILETPYLLHIGRFHPIKRHDLLLKAFKLIKAPYKLVLVTKPCPKLSALVKKQGLENDVIIVAFQKNIFPWLKQAKLLVVSSDSEGLGNVVVESLTCQTPVVSTNCCGPAETLSGKLAHWLVPVNDHLALAQKIDEALVTNIEIPDESWQRFSAENIAKLYLKSMSN